MRPLPRERNGETADPGSCEEARRDFPSPRTPLCMRLTTALADVTSRRSLNSASGIKSASGVYFAAFFFRLNMNADRSSRCSGDSLIFGMVG